MLKVRSYHPCVHSTLVPFHFTQRQKLKSSWPARTTSACCLTSLLFLSALSPFSLIWPHRPESVLLLHHPRHTPASESRYLTCLPARKLFPRLVQLWLRSHLSVVIPRLLPACTASSFLLAWKLLCRRQLEPVPLAFPGHSV